MSVNLSSRQLHNKDIPGVFARILAESGLAAEYLELEIVESMVMKDVESALTILKELKALGIKLAMDDFGTGYSSLSYLKRFPFDKLKIDLSFVRDILIDPESAAIARTIIAMAHTLNLRVIAEGVETTGQRDYLRANSCDEMQGFLFSRPVTAHEMEIMLRDERKLSFHPLPPRSPNKKPPGRLRPLGGSLLARPSCR
jgi:EAL domain-containing protein (putative c-di-GMP-specific phosphodiesterase class I)